MCMEPPKKSPIVKIILKKKKKSGGIMLPGFKLHSKASKASLVAQMVKNLRTMQKTRV